MDKHEAKGMFDNKIFGAIDNPEHNDSIMAELNNKIKLHAISGDENKNMANGMRNTSGAPLSSQEIEFVKR